MSRRRLLGSVLEDRCDKDASQVSSDDFTQRLYQMRERNIRTDCTNDDLRRSCNTRTDPEGACAQGIRDNERSLDDIQAILDEQTTCCVCLEPFSEDRPARFLTTCLHKICLPCLQELREHHTRNNPNDTDEERLLCPYCRKPSSVLRSHIEPVIVAPQPAVVEPVVRRRQAVPLLPPTVMIDGAVSFGGSSNAAARHFDRHAYVPTYFVTQQGQVYMNGPAMPTQFFMISPWGQDADMRPSVVPYDATQRFHGSIQEASEYFRTHQAVWVHITDPIMGLFTNSLASPTEFRQVVILPLDSLDASYQAEVQYTDASRAFQRDPSACLRWLSEEVMHGRPHIVVIQDGQTGELLANSSNDILRLYACPAWPQVDPVPGIPESPIPYMGTQRFGGSVNNAMNWFRDHPTVPIVSIVYSARVQKMYVNSLSSPLRFVEIKPIS